jgi:D-alanyl-D-alanine carboxypeptidase/D-alanyl-D-alanine-endopeptidase (penicillin-binding protein 4)
VRPRSGRLLAVALGLITTGACAARQAPPAPSPAGATPRPVADVPASPDAALGAAFDARFAATDDRVLWAVRLELADTRVVLATRNADRLVIPASNMKIVTLVAAASRLGWDYRFRTRLHATGPTDGHVLRGDLVVVGSADPTIGRGDDPLATFREWARALRAKGISRIEGDLVGDPTRLGEEWLGDSWSWDDLAFGYAAPYSGLTFHENVVRVRITPAAATGKAARATLWPSATGLALQADVQTTGVAAPAVQVSRALGSPTIEVTGAVPQGGTRVERLVAVPDPARYFLGALRTAFAEEGVEIRGGTRVATRRDVDGTTPLVVHESAPLSDVAVRFMKVSQNLYGEILLRALAADAPGGPTPAAARAEVQQVLAALGIAPGTVQELDGSGLSRRDFVTARAITTLLHAMRQPPHKDVFRATLPIAGTDGTIGSRFTGSPCAGRLLAKTGTLAHARALSGYITSASGVEYVFSVIANNFLLPNRDVDAVVEDALALVCAS